MGEGSATTSDVLEQIMQSFHSDTPPLQPRRPRVAPAGDRAQEAGLAGAWSERAVDEMAHTDTHPGFAAAEGADVAVRPGVNSIAKRVVDLLVAIPTLVFVSPLLLAVAVAIRLEDGGPVFFLQRRNGQGRQIFRIMKFRSMRTMDDGATIKQAVPGDSRITRVGSFIRKSSIDELPQLFNVIMGDMSIVGPRPHALAHDDLFAARVNDYNLRFRCKPGITGLAQIKGERGLIQSDDDVARRLHFDLEYQNRWSVFFDLWVIGITPWVLVTHLFHKRAY